MIQIRDEGIILEPRDLAFEREGVMNPTCVDAVGGGEMFYRAVGKNNFSTIGWCRLKNKKVVERSDKPMLVPEHDFEKQGMEDPRITFLDGKYYLMYTAYDGQNARVAYAESLDLRKFEKKGLVSPVMSYDLAEDIFRYSGVNWKYAYFEKLFRELRGDGVMLWEKDASLFPEKIGGKYALLHRVLPGIQICYFDDFEQLKEKDFWKHYLVDLDHYILMDPSEKHENGYIGGGAVPVKTDEGWLVIYHSVEINKGRKIYHASAALLDGENPKKVIGRLKGPLFSPEALWEKEGAVDNVVFPTGTMVVGSELTIYYGAADTRIGAKYES